jgi:hypothetical protein
MIESHRIPRELQILLLAQLRNLPMEKTRFQRTAYHGKSNNVVVGLNWSFQGTRLGARTMSVLPYIRVVTQVVQKLFPEFAYTTISTNRDFPGYLHIDGKNVGPSVMLTVGEAITGGELWYDGKVIPTAGMAICFDGNNPHMTLPYSTCGSRWSIVCYAFKSWSQVPHLLPKLLHIGIPAIRRHLPVWATVRMQHPTTQKQRLICARRLIQNEIHLGILPANCTALLVKPKSKAYNWVAKNFDRSKRRSKNTENHHIASPTTSYGKDR